MKKYYLIALAVVAALVACNKDPEVTKDKDGNTEENTAFVTKDATTVCINEVNGGTGYKGIELYNPTDAEINLEGYTIIKNDEEAVYWTGVNGDKIAAKGYLVIRASKETGELDALTNLSVDKGTGGLSGKKIVKLDLKDATKIIDTFDRGWTKHWDGSTELGLSDAGTNSFARQQDGKKTWKVMSPTMGATNAGATVVGDVTIDPE